MTGRAPAWARRLLGRIVPEARREDVIGDLDEAHAARTGRDGPASAWVRTSLEALDVAWVFLRLRLRLRLREATVPMVSWPEVRLALRLARRSPLLSVTATLALATGIGVAVTGYTMVDTLVWGTLPWEGGDRFVMVGARSRPENAPVDLGRERLLLLREATDVFREVGVIRSTRVNLRHAPGEVESVRGAYVSPSLFRAVPVVPQVGRTLTTGDVAAGSGRVAVLRESLWLRRYGGDASVVGRPIEIGGEPHVVVGVLPDSVRFSTAELWIPLPDPGPGEAVGGRVFGLLVPGLTPQAAEARIAPLGTRTGGDGEVGISVRHLTDEIVHGPVEALMLALVAVLVLVLVVIAANVAHLFYARAVARGAEMSVRTALGASRARLVGQLGAEVLVLGGVAAVVGVAAAGAVTGRMGSVMEGMPWLDFTMDGTKAAFGVGVTLLAVLVAGVWPALRATREAPAVGMRVGRSVAGDGMGRAGSVMIVAEVALSVALLGTALVVARGFAAYAEPRVTLPRGEVVASWVGPMEPARARAFIDALESVPGVAVAAAATHLPRQEPETVPVRLEDGDPDALPAGARRVAILPGFFEVMGARATAGRLLGDGDIAPGAAPVVVVNEPFVEVFLGGRNAVGRRLVVGDRAMEIVGVVPDLGMSLGDPRAAAGLYVPLGDEAFQFVVRAPAPWALEGRLRAALATVDPSLAPGGFTLLERAAEENVAFLRGMSLALLGVGGVALLLSLVGTYALLSWAVTRRTREIGIRVALGARPGLILRGILGGAALRLGAGAVLGTAFGQILLAGRDLFTFRLPDPGPLPFVAVVALLLVAGGTAAWIPCLRALRVRPMEALRAE